MSKDEKYIDMEEATNEINEDDVRETYEMLKEIFEPDSDSDDDYTQPPLMLDDIEITDMVNSDEFQNGQKVASYYAGIFTTLVNSGVPIKNACEFIIHEQNNLNDVTLQNINKEIAKINAIKVEQQSI